MYTPTSLHPGDKYWRSFTKTWHNAPYPEISPLRPELQATNKVVFITGGGTGIGKATAIAFAQAGAKAIAIFGRRVDKLQTATEEIRKANPNGTTTVIFEAVDLSQRAAVAPAFKNAINKVGGGEAKMDIFIHGAGFLQANGSVAGYAYDDFRNGLDINMGGAFNAVQAMLPLLAPDAKVFNITSSIGHVSLIPGCWAYAATKIANSKIFEYLQAENPGLSVVNVHPGVVTTELNAELGDIGVDDVNLPAHFMIWLSSPEAQFLKGKLVWVNWDVNELKERADEIKSSLVLTVGLHGVPL